MTYLEAYRGMTNFMRSTMCFYNHFNDNETINGIVFLPYTPKMLDYLSPL